MILDRAEAERLVSQWDALAWRFAGAAMARVSCGDIEDYHAEAVAGLWFAATRFDPAAGAQFQTYAGHYARGFVSRLAENEAAGGLHVPQVRGVRPAAGATFVPLDTAQPAAPDASEESTGPDPAAVWGAVDAALDVPADRLVLRLQFAEGLTVRDVAAHIGATVAAVGNRSRRALARLRESAELRAFVA